MQTKNIPAIINLFTRPDLPVNGTKIPTAIEITALKTMEIIKLLFGDFLRFLDLH